MKTSCKCILVLLLWQAAALPAATTVTNIAAGYFNTLFIKSDGSLWATGFNSYTPEQILFGGAIAISPGYDHTLLLKSGGSLWAMGDNSYGELGDGTFNSADQPEEIISNDVVAIAVGGYGGYSSLFLKADGSLWAMGNNSYGQLGDSTFDNTNRPQEIVSNGVVAIAAGGGHSLLLKTDGSLWGMGDNESGQLGDGTFNNTNRPEEIVASRVVAIAAANSGLHSLFIKADGSLWAMGYNGFGQLGDGTFNNTNRPEEIVPSGVVAVAAGEEYSLFLKSDGSIWGMGANFYGQLGDGTTTSVSMPEQIVASSVIAIAAGSFHSLFLKSDGSLWGMGLNVYGQLGDGFGGDSPVPEQIFPPPLPVLSVPFFPANNAANAVTKVAAGIGSSFFIKADGSLWAMGWNSLGQLGDGTFNTAISPEQIISSGVITVATHGFYRPPGGLAYPSFTSHTLFLKSDGSLWGMGDNSVGQLGDGTFSSPTRPDEIVSNGVAAIAAGRYHSLFLRARLKYPDSDGSRGNEDQISPWEQRAFEPSKPPDAGSYGFFRHRLRFGGSLWGMGDNEYGQLGDGTFNSTNRPEEIVSNGVAAIAAGADHSVFLKTDGSLWAMGYNGYGQLGDGTRNNASQPEEIVSNGVVAIAAGDYFSLLIKSDGSLWGMGDNYYGQLGEVKLGGGLFSNPYYPKEIVSNGVVAIAAGDYHTLFLKIDGSLWAMGDNFSGQLGDGTTHNTNQPEEIISNGVVAISAGDSGSLFQDYRAVGSFSLFVKSDGSLWGMGDNSFYELGNGSTTNSLYPLKLASGPWLRATCGVAGTYYLLTSTNLAQPVSQWTRIWTNTIVLRGNNNFYALLNSTPISSPGQQFYILQSQ